MLSVRYGDLILWRRVLMCVCTCQASVTLNWRVSGVDAGPDLVHPQHELSASVTGRICVSTSIFIMGLTRRFGETATRSGTNEYRGCHESRHFDHRQASHLQRPLRRCCRFNQNSLIVQRGFPRERFFLGSVKLFP